MGLLVTGAADLTAAEGGSVHGYGWSIPYGGVLDVASGTWSRLPHAPADGSGGWPVFALGGPVTASSGWLYDDTARSWRRLPRPADAPTSPGHAVWASGTLFVLGGHRPQQRSGPARAL